MQLVQLGKHKMVMLEFDLDFIANIIKQAGFEHRLEDGKRHIVLELTAADRDSPLLLFDAADPGNLGWFSRCSYYVDGCTGGVMQTPITVANQRDRGGRVLPNALRVQISKELPYGFRMPGRQAVTEQIIYGVFYNFLLALLNVGVGVCGGTLVKPLAGRTDGVGIRN